MYVRVSVKEYVRELQGVRAWINQFENMGGYVFS